MTPNELQDILIMLSATIPAEIFLVTMKIYNE
jgi:hypothetical protein